MGPVGARGGDASGAPGPDLSLAAWSELLLPTRCLGCGGVGVGGHLEPVCPRCRTRIRDWPGPRCTRCRTPELPWGGGCRFCEAWPAELVAARSATLFDGPAAALVHALKYEGWTSLASFLGERMCRSVSDGRVDPFAAVVPVPSTPGRVRERGFNPARLLADEVSQRLRIPLADALLRVREGPRQIGLPPSQRAANVRDAFVPNGASSGPLLPEHVLLVDDVLTTGATGVEAAKAAAAIGARRVTLLTFARALPELPGSAPGPVHLPEGVN